MKLRIVWMLPLLVLAVVSTSCGHRGEVGDAMAKSSDGLPSVDDVINRYVEATGGVYTLPRSVSTTREMAYSFGFATGIFVDPGPVRVAVFDARGRLVRTLAAGVRPQGPLDLAWDGTDDAGRGVASGLYFYRAVAGAESVVGKLVLVR